jgi:outer membrane protein assembly factor BamA
MHSTKSVEQLWGIEAFIRYDTRDLYSYPAKGWYHRLVLYKNGIFQTHNNYYKIDHEIRHYLHFGKVILAGRFYNSYLFGEIPVYRLNYIGFDERVRGHFYDVLEGRHINMGSLEVRFPIIPIRYFSLNLPPIPAQYLRNLQLGLSGGFFIDSGIIWNKGHEYAWDQFKTGYGFGLHLHLPYVQVLRFDYAFNRDFTGQFIFEVGVAF